MRLLLTPWFYALVLLFSLLGLTIADWRWRLVVFGHDDNEDRVRRRAALTTLVIMVGAFLLWDVLGIGLGIFSTNPRYVIGLTIVSRNLPIEEIGFLILLNYFTLLVVAFMQRHEAGAPKRQKGPGKP